MRPRVFLQFFKFSLGPTQPTYTLSSFASLAYGPSYFTGVDAKPLVRQCRRHGDLPGEVLGEVFGHFDSYSCADTDTTGAFRKGVRRGVEVVRADLKLAEETNRRVGLWEGRSRG